MYLSLSGAEAQAALRQASVDNHAVVLEPVRLPEDQLQLTLLRSGSGKTKRLGLPEDQAATPFNADEGLSCLGLEDQAGAGSDSSGLE